MGIHPMGLQWHLKQGGVFNTPEAVLVRSDEGLGKHLPLIIFYELNF